jgi:hypothetical protein
MSDTIGVYIRKKTAKIAKHTQSSQRGILRKRRVLRVDLRALCGKFLTPSLPPPLFPQLAKSRKKG